MAPSRGAMKHKRKPLLSHGRPTKAQRSAVQSSRRTRAIIRSHHQLQQARANAIAQNDQQLAADLESQIQSQGGLEEYQKASIAGQSATRGGDSSKLLVTWCYELGLRHVRKNPHQARLLEVGALSVDNACSTAGIFDVHRIDLHSQGQGILQQDFMERPLPQHDDEKFDVISMSLVLNYVPEPIGRGEMLRRVRYFLRSHPALDNGEYSPLPLLFLVLPAPCIENSRYMSSQRLHEIMTSLSFELVRVKLSSKLIYSLWRLSNAWSTDSTPFAKTEVNPGKRRNNFAIIIR